MNSRIILSTIFISLLLIASCGRKTKSTTSEASPDTVVYQPEIKYGIIVDSLELYKSTVKRDQNLADILLPYNISYSHIDYIARNSMDSFDVRKIRAGNDYAILYHTDSVPVADYFIYENNPVEYTVFDIRDSLKIYRAAHPTDTVVDYCYGIIESSLWNAMTEANADPMLAVELSEIYAWTIDFFGIQKGDEFRVLYEKVYKEDEYIGLGKVITAELIHMNNPFVCYRFTQDDDTDYYDELGGSMRRTFLKAPLRYSRVSSGFSYARRHPVLKIVRPHLGIDYAAPEGTPVYSIGDGVVTKKGYERNGGGNYLMIKHNGTYSTEYMHLKSFAKGIKQGSKVKQGQLIGYVGATGLATGPHLDFRVFRNGHAMNPNNLKAPPAKPVDSIYLDRFMLEKQQLDSIMNRFREEWNLMTDTLELNHDTL
jgi:murein DD-endopeptidase MepM/ murein hydrolase activator NlpD